MNVHDLRALTSKGEGLKIEFKHCADAVSGSFYETVVSFSNTDGGTILLGVNDDGQIIGIDPVAVAKIKKDIIATLNSTNCINPPIYIQPFIIEHPDGLVMVIQIPSSSQIHQYKGRIYSREFESDLDVTDDQYRVSDLYLRKRNFFSETKIYPALTMADLDPKLFQKARELIRSNRGDHPWLLVNDEQMLRDTVLWRKDFLGYEEGLTLGAALIFGKDATIQSLLPAYKVEAMVRIQNTDRWDDRINPPLRTNLIDSYLLLKQFINKHLPEHFYVEADQRIDLRDKIFREVIGNVVIHREYTSALSTDVIISKDSVTITNPNKPHFTGPIDPYSFNPFPKNPNIRKIFNAFGWADEIGSGIRNANKYLPLYVHGARPNFIEGYTFCTEIPLAFIALGKFADRWLDWLDLPDRSLMHLREGLHKVPLPARLVKAEWKEVALYLLSEWQSKGTNLPILNWPKDQLFTQEEVENVPSWSEKGTKLFHKKVRYILAILAYCSSPISLSDLMSYLSYNNRKTFRDNYMKPLEQLQWITRTNLQVPLDPNQKYKLTERGKEFLGG